MLIGSKLPSALPTFLGSIQGEGLGVGEEEQQPESGRQEGVREELATFCSSQDQAMMQDCYSKIVEKLSLANPTMVLQVRGCTQPFTLFRGQSLYHSYTGNIFTLTDWQAPCQTLTSHKWHTSARTEYKHYTMWSCYCHISYGQKDDHITWQFLMISNPETSPKEWKISIIKSSWNPI